MTLMLHTGAKAVAYGDLRAIPLPEATDSYVPIAHTLSSTW
jgi:hypothetical protein